MNKYEKIQKPQYAEAWEIIYISEPQDNGYVVLTLEDDSLYAIPEDMRMVVGDYLLCRDGGAREGEIKYTLRRADFEERYIKVEA